MRLLFHYQPRHFRSLPSQCIDRLAPITGLRVIRHRVENFFDVPVVFRETPANPPLLPIPYPDGSQQLQPAYNSARRRLSETHSGFQLPGPDCCESSARTANRPPRPSRPEHAAGNHPKVFPPRRYRTLVTGLAAASVPSTFSVLFLSFYIYVWTVHPKGGMGAVSIGSMEEASIGVWSLRPQGVDVVSTDAKNSMATSNHPLQASGATPLQDFLV
jgi:hypothetical protein